MILPIIGVFSVAIGCGESDGKPDSGQDGPFGTGGIVATGGVATGGSAGETTVGAADSGTGGVATGGGPGTSDAAPMLPCPTDPPTAGQECGQLDTCYYEDCGAAGLVFATCGGTWSVETRECSGSQCESPTSITYKTCSTGQLCVRLESGIVIADCKDNPCKDGIVTSLSCLRNAYPDCSVNIAPWNGIIIHCQASGCPGTSSSTGCQ